LTIHSGNSDPFELGEWVPLLFGDVPEEESCSGLTVTLKILYSRVGSQANPQNRIVGANLQYDAHVISTGSVLDLNTELFTLVTIVTFFDVTKHSNTQADVPAYSFRLPTDFFYPFVWATNTSSHSVVTNQHMFIVLLLIFIHFY